MVNARPLALAGLTIATVLGVGVLREVSIGRHAALAAETAIARSDWREAIGDARAAAEALAPGSPWPECGFRALASIGHDAQARGDDAIALLAFGAMRSAAMETRTVGAHSRWRSAAEEGLAEVAASSKDASTPRVSADAMLRALERDEGPHPASIAILTVSAVAMIVGLAGLVFAGEGEKRGRLARGLAAAGFAAYAITAFVNAR